MHLSNKWWRLLIHELENFTNRICKIVCKLGKCCLSSYNQYSCVGFLYHPQLIRLIAYSLIASYCYPSTSQKAPLNGMTLVKRRVL